jgi:Fe-S cluster assembly iron-binding protein IscA
MLRLTEDAVAALRELLSAYEGRRDAALRFVVGSSAEGSSGLLLSLSTPRAGDLVSAGRGLRVFLEPGAAELLDGKLLDVKVERGRVRFLAAPYRLTR